jgi:hypothetical protein
VWISSKCTLSIISSAEDVAQTLEDSRAGTMMHCEFGARVHECQQQPDLAAGSHDG